MASREQRIVLSLAVVLILAVTTSVAEELDPQIVLEEIGASRIDVEGAIEIRDLKLNAGLASIRLNDGIVFPATRVAGATVEVVFLGEGRVHLDPPDEIEAGQLRLFTGGSRLDEAFDQAVLVVPLDAASKLILDNRDAAQPTEEQIDLAREVHRQWKYGKVRGSLGVEGTLLMDALGDPLAGGFFAAWFHTEDLGDFFYILEPDQPEQVTVGQFVPLEMSDYEADQWAAFIRKQQKRGGWIGVVRSDLGMWDTWVRSSLRGAGGQPTRGGEGFEPLHYALEVDLADGSLEMQGKARIELMATMSGRTFVPFRLVDRWSVREVRDENGNVLYHHHDEGRLLVRLGQAVTAKDNLTLEIAYSGQPFVSLDKRKKVMADTTGWYPTTGRIDRAPYDVTFRWPTELSLVSAGERVEGGAGEDGRQWERRRQEAPSFGFSFEIGDLETETIEVGHVAVDIAHHAGNELTEEAKSEIRDTIRDALTYYEELFGSYPLDYLTVVTAPREFSQGLLSFVTLSEYSMMDLGILGALAGNIDRRLTVAHELAHQWWGNLVGWQSYRDQWISEAIAEYAAQRYADRITWDDGRIAAGPTTGWYGHLTSGTPSGLDVEAIGPMVLGERLDSSRGLAYNDIVYRKGAVTLETLVWYYGENRLNEALAGIVEAASNRIVSTDAFFGLAGRILRDDLGWFVEQYVRGTGIPEIHYDYEFIDNGDGTWTIEGDARKIEHHTHEYLLVETEDGSLDVRRTPVEAESSAQSRVVSPIQVLVFDPSRDSPIEEPEQKKKKKKKKSDAPGLEELGNAVMSGRIVIDGESAPIRLEVPHEPRVVWLDRNNEIFAEFYSVQGNPKRAYYRQGMSHHSAGRIEEAEEALLAALESEYSSDPDLIILNEDFLEEQASRMNSEIHLRLARLYTDRGDYDAAREQIVLAKKAYGQSSYQLNKRLDVYESRIDLLEGDPERAFNRLKKLDAGFTAVSTEGYMLFAIAAKRVGKEKAFERALRVLRARDADVTLLTR